MYLLFVFAFPASFPVAFLALSAVASPALFPVAFPAFLLVDLPN